MNGLLLFLYTIVLQKAGMQPDDLKIATFKVLLLHELMMGICSVFSGQ